MGSQRLKGRVQHVVQKSLESEKHNPDNNQGFNEGWIFSLTEYPALLFYTTHTIVLFGKFSMLVMPRGHEVEPFEHLPDGTIVRVDVILFT